MGRPQAGEDPGAFPATERRRALLDRLAIACEAERDLPIFGTTLDRHLDHLSDDAVAGITLAIGHIARALAGFAGRVDGGTLRRFCREAGLELREQLEKRILEVVVADGAPGDVDLLLDDAPQRGGRAGIRGQDNVGKPGDDGARGAHRDPDLRLGQPLPSRLVDHVLPSWLVSSALVGALGGAGVAGWLARRERKARTAAPASDGAAGQ